MKKLSFFLGSLAVAAIAFGTGLHSYGQKKAPDDTAEIRALEQRFIAAFNARNTAAIMDCYARGQTLFVFDIVPPRQYVGWEAYKKDWADFLAQYPGAYYETGCKRLMLLGLAPAVARVFRPARPAGGRGAFSGP